MNQSLSNDLVKKNYAGNRHFGYYDNQTNKSGATRSFVLL